jgi:glucose/arabinose dehydrogenase
MLLKNRSKMVRWCALLLSIVALSALLPVHAQEEEEEYKVGVELVAEGFASPVMLTTPNDGTGRLFIVDQAGTIRIIDANGQLLPDPFLDLSGLIVALNPNYDERGVLGLAFHPDYANNGRFFVYYTTPLREGAPAGWDHTNVVGELNVSADNPNVADLASLKTVLQIDQPQFNHDAGHIAFGPDGYLYIPIGDGGGANDNEEGHTPGLGNGQDTSNLHGSILRIDVNGEPGSYTIPADNIFAGEDDKADEIYAYGFRNPYHISFDMGGDNALFVADAGQDLYEEVDMVMAGGNYGWNIKEGTHCFDPANPETPPASCADTGASGDALLDPIIEYSHDDVGVVVVGGYVYRGSALPDLEGYYVFGDYSSTVEGQGGTLLWAEAPEDDASGMWEWGEITVVGGMGDGRIGANVLAVGQDADGELYVLTNEGNSPTGDTGKVWKIVPSEEDAGSMAEATDEAGMTETSGTTDTSGGATEPMETPESSG